VGDCGVPYLLYSKDTEMSNGDVNTETHTLLQESANTTGTSKSGNSSVSTLQSYGVSECDVDLDVIRSTVPNNSSDYVNNEFNYSNANIDNDFDDSIDINKHCIRGELWEVTGECLQNLDDYEGINKGYYKRKKIDIYYSSVKEGTSLEQLSPSMLVSANVYVLCKVPHDLMAKPCIEEYTMDIHKSMYSPISHIQVKQLNYIKKPSGWGKINNQVSDGYNDKTFH
jgi:hypothetical protein